MKKYLTAFALVIVLIALAWGGKTAHAPERGDTSLRIFFDQNLAALSPEKPVLGGSFHVTDLEAHDGAGTVHYEDGHNAYVADFLYSDAGNGAVRVESFMVRK